MSDGIQSIEDLIESGKQSGAADEDTLEGKFAKKQREIQLKDLERLTATHAQSAGTPYIDLSGFPISQEALALIDETEARKLNLVCFYFDGKRLRLAALAPLSSEVRAKLSELENKLFIENGEIYMVSSHSMEHALWLYKSLPKIKAAAPSVEIGEAELEKFKKEIDDFHSLNTKVNEVNMSEILVLLIAAALKIGSSDIHVEAEEQGVVIRLRVDGVLQEAAVINKDKWKRIISRLKILSKVKINIEDKPQDGRFDILTSDEKIAVRSSFLPTAFGESVVMRLLRSSSVALSFEALGLMKQEYERLSEEVDKPNGLVLVTGPTGSGKTTTLYAMLNRLNKPGTKIITLEDPVEYQLEGINQSQIEETKGYTFASGLRSVLRQDPDIVMVGETRDIETAEIAVRAALTGHLVLSTLHTNDASGVIPRLLDLGIQPYLLAPALNAIVGQRLVRKLCPVCKAKRTITPEEEEKIKKILAVISPRANVDVPKELPEIYKAVGCDKCNQLGYKGRIGIYEVLTMDSNIKELTSQNAPSFKILEQAIENGMITMLQDGVLKALQGVTSLEEVYEAAGKMEYVDKLYDIVVSKTIGRGLKLTEADMGFGEEITKAIGQDSAKLLENHHTNEIINIVMAGALKAEAGDVHIDPNEDGITIRYRIDGILHDIAKLGREHYIPLLSEIKNTAGFAANIKKPTYDGRFTIYGPEMKVDCRISIIIGGYGETAVIRLLSSQAKTLELEKLGISSVSLETINVSIKKTKGIILTTGPTGSGKTTTLYGLLNKLNNPSVKIITIEDPIEYNLEGIIQTQVNTEEGYTFAAALRSLMRQNPNIIMVGEIRDDETAKVAIEAALTGHLVLSTIHANSAAGAISRFVGLGVDKPLLSSSMECSIGQRLVRKLCPSCKVKAEIDAAMKQKVDEMLARISKNAKIVIPKDFSFYKPVGCEKCGKLGYKGRVGIYEAITMTPEMQKLIQTASVTELEIENLAIDQGSMLMMHDGILKAMNGETTLDEVFRVAG